MLRAAALVLLGMLVAAAPALADNGGLTPVEPASENARAIRDAYMLVLIVTGFVFVVVETTLVVFLVKYRRGKRAREGEGPQVRGHTRIEVAWTIVPVLLLAAITAFVFTQLPEIEDAPAAGPADSLRVTVEGHQYYWLYRYPGGEIAVDDLVVPVNKVVTLEVVAPDVIHSWWIPALGGKIDAIPGRTNETWFRAERTGTFVGRCAELCGAQHAAMRASVRAVSDAEFSEFLASHAPSGETVGQETLEGVCAKCHGLQGEGTDEAPPIAGREFDTTTVALIKGGGVRMPAVGEDWSEEHVDAVIDYLNQSIGAQSGG
ncbi:MAG TPA: cytochrome c oxidase subunit II [Gaiellaceae bacterium]|nr:cytochrome c oxidase subunit II [Gaiellaceae bacterium]